MLTRFYQRPPEAKYPAKEFSVALKILVKANLLLRAMTLFDGLARKLHGLIPIWMLILLGAVDIRVSGQRLPVHSVFSIGVELRGATN